MSILSIQGVALEPVSETALSDTAATPATPVTPLPTPKQAREAAGFRGAEGIERLAKIIRRSPSWVRLVDNGYRPNYLMLCRLARALHCSCAIFQQPSGKTQGGKAAASVRRARDCRNPKGRPARPETEQSVSTRGGIATTPTVHPVYLARPNHSLAEEVLDEVFP